MQSTKKPAHHRPDGGYRNPWLRPVVPGALPSGDDAASIRLAREVRRRTTGRGWAGLLRWQWERLRDGRPPDPPASALPRLKPDVARPRGAPDELRVTWVGHATALLQLGGLNVLTDPVFSRRASPVQWTGPARLVEPGLELDALPPLDAILVSHDHFDHLDLGSVRRLASAHPGAVWLTPLGYRGWLARRGVRAMAELDWWQDVGLEGARGRLRATAVPAQHWTARSPFVHGRRLWCAWALEAGGTRVFFGGDSGYFPGYAAIGRACGPFDAALLPIGAYEPQWFMRPMHMNPEEALRAYHDLGGRGAFVPIHWGTFRLADEAPLEPPRRLRTAWAEAGLPPDDLWVLAHGETRARRVAAGARARTG